jgi:hypothetical protein
MDEVIASHLEGDNEAIAASRWVQRPEEVSGVH